MFCDGDRKMLKSVFNFIDIMRKMASERGDFYSVADKFRKRIDNFEHDMIVRADEIKDVTHNARIELEKTIRPDIDALKAKFGVTTDCAGKRGDNGGRVPGGVRTQGETGKAFCVFVSGLTCEQAEMMEKMVRSMSDGLAGKVGDVFSVVKSLTPCEYKVMMDTYAERAGSDVK